MLLDPTDIVSFHTECRNILREPSYSKQLTAKLIGLLRHSNAAISDIAGRCLMKLGEPAFDDLLEVVTAPGESPWPNAVWVLSAISSESESHRLLPLLRAWLENASDDLAVQCALSLGDELARMKRAGQQIDPADIEACLNVLQHNAQAGGAAGPFHLRQFRVHLELA